METDIVSVNVQDDQEKVASASRFITCLQFQLSMINSTWWVSSRTTTSSL